MPSKRTTHSSGVNPTLRPGDWATEMRRQDRAAREES